MSNRLTFSLASLIFLIAFGLVFAPMSVMAHPVTTDNNGTGEIHDGDAVGLVHTHPSITVTIADADSRTDGIQVVDTEADEPATPTPADVTPTIQFDVTLTVPVGAEYNNNGASIVAATFDGLTIVAYKPDFTTVGNSIVLGAFAQADATGAPRAWTATALLTLANVTFNATNAVDPDSPTAAEATKARQAAIAAAIKAGIMVDVTVPEDAIQTSGLVGGPMLNQGNLESKTTVTVIAPLPDNTRPTLTVSSTEPAAAVTTGSFDIIYSTSDADMDTVTVAVSHTVVPTSAAMHYTVDDSVDGTVTVNQATADATTPMVPPASVTVTLTPSDDGGAGTAETFTVFFAAATYTAPNQLPTVTTTPAKAPTDAVDSPYTFTYAGADADAGDTVTVAVTHAVLPTGAASHYTVDSTTTAGSVTVTQAMPSATMKTIPAATVTVTLTPNDGTADGAAVEFAVSFTAKTYTPPTDTLAAEEYQVLVGPGFDATTLPGVATVEIANFPDDLAEYLVAGGTINVEATGGDVIINEFMVARDSHKIGSGDPTDGQWIELYNKHATEKATGIKVTFNQSKPAESPAGYADRFSNVVGQGWAFLTKFNDQKVINGSTNEKAPVNFVSIRRTDTNKDGSEESAWGMAETSLVFAPGRVGTPGGQNTVDVFKPVENTKPKRSSVLISEVANRTNNGTEWIELKGPPGKNLKNWKLSIATALDTETNIYTFTTDIKISNNGYLLLTDVDPLNSELAADYTNGVPAPKRYKVVTLGVLPNDGNFVLILRSNKDKTNHEAIEDIAGYANLSRTNPYTTLWPLTGNVGKLNSKNKLEGGKVYRRLRDNIDGYSQEGNDANKPAFGAVGFTGLGYDRNADARDAENGGTPGYPHSAYKHNGADAKGNVVISEIMFATGNGGPARNQNLSQWIEIHNMSDVHSVRLDDWRLEIVNSGENADGTEYAGNFAENVNLSGTLPPNQTYLIVARRLGVSQNTRLPVERIRNAGREEVR